LQDDSYLRAEGGERHAADVSAINRHGAPRYVVEARNQVDNGALTASGRPKNCYGLPWLRLEGDAAQRLLFYARVAKMDILERDAPLYPAKDGSV
jgi:hypothetical protein